MTKVAFHEYYDFKERTLLLAVGTVVVELGKNNTVLVKGADGLYVRQLEESPEHHKHL